MRSLLETQIHTFYKVNRLNRKFRDRNGYTPLSNPKRYYRNGRCKRRRRPVRRNRDLPQKIRILCKHGNVGCSRNWNILSHRRLPKNRILDIFYSYSLPPRQCIFIISQTFHFVNRLRKIRIAFFSFSVKIHAVLLNKIPLVFV